MRDHVKKFKVRTGCITCKIRKVKCDEGKPDCLRCTSTGRKCDGYATPDTAISRSEHLGQRGSSLIQYRSDRRPGRPYPAVFSILDLPSLITADENRWLAYFSRETAPALSDIADQDFWTHVLPQVSMSEPAVRHAILAVSSTYAGLCAQSDTEGGTSYFDYSYSIGQYTRAIAELRRTLAQNPRDPTVALICSLLFLSLECLHGNKALMNDHLNNGLNILSSQEAKANDPSKAMQPISKRLAQVFRRLDGQSTLQGKHVFLPSCDPIHVSELEIPSTFENLPQAKMFLDTINSMSLGFIRLANDGALLDRYETCSITILQDRLQEKFIAWANALDRFEREGDQTKEFDRNIITRLKIEYNASFIYLSNCLELDESSYDVYIEQFGTMVSLARSITFPTGESTPSDFSSHGGSSPSSTGSYAPPKTFTLSASLLPSLYLAAIKCRHPTIRREAISLLARNNNREGLWFAKVNCHIARRIVEIEESSMLMYEGAAEAYMEPGPSMKMFASNGAVLGKLPLDAFRITAADLNRPFIDNKPQYPLSITFYTKGNGVLQPEHYWLEEVPM